MIPTERDVFQMEEVTVLRALWKHVYKRIRFIHTIVQYFINMLTCAFVFLHFESDRVRWAWVLSRWPPDCRMMVDYTEASVVCSQQSEINGTASFTSLHISSTQHDSHSSVHFYHEFMSSIIKLSWPDFILIDFCFTSLHKSLHMDPNPTTGSDPFHRIRLTEKNKQELPKIKSFHHLFTLIM